MFGVIEKLRRLLLPREKAYFLILTVFVFFGSLLELAGIGLTMPVVALFVNEKLFQDNEILSFYYHFLGCPDMRTLMLLTCLGIGVFFILKNIYLFFIVWVQMKFTFSLAERASNLLFEKYRMAPYSFHLTRSTALSVEIVNSTRYAFAETVINMMFLLSEVMVTAVLFVSIVIVAPGIALGIAVVILGLSAAVYFPLKNREQNLGARATDLSSNVTAAIMQMLEAVKEVKLAGRGPVLSRRFRKIQYEATEVKRLQISYAQVPRFVLEAAIVVVGMGMIAVMLALGVTPASIALKISFIGIALVRAMPSLGRSHYYLANIKGQEGAIERIVKDMNELQEENLDESKPPLTLRRELVLENLAFGYRENVLLFRNLSFRIPANSSIALVGPTGCGKTTLIDLLIGLHTPVEGRILSDGRDIRENMPSWRARIGYVPQSIPILDASVLENVAFGVERAEIDESRVIESLKMAQAFDFVEKLDDGLFTIVGERGIRLSGGQRQRIGIARALYTRPELLVFDEATSALDVKTEAEFVEALSSLRGKITMIVAAHRLSTVENCDGMIDFTKLRGA